MMKRGFTLIELMVVIVIIGILAAIAIPKLFGMSAKAKVSEVGPAAGTWSKLQTAFVLETGCMGNFKAIGYKAPGNGGVSANFTYTQSSGGNDDAAANIAADADLVATATTKLNDCVDGVWTVEMASEGAPAMETGITGTNCAELTPNFDKLEKQ